MGFNSAFKGLKAAAIRGVIDSSSLQCDRKYRLAPFQKHVTNCEDVTGFVPAAWTKPSYVARHDNVQTPLLCFFSNKEMA